MFKKSTFQQIRKGHDLPPIEILHTAPNLQKDKSQTNKKFHKISPDPDFSDSSKILVSGKKEREQESNSNSESNIESNTESESYNKFFGGYGIGGGGSKGIERSISLKTNRHNIKKNIYTNNTKVPIEEMNAHDFSKEENNLPQVRGAHQLVKFGEMHVRNSCHTFTEQSDEYFAIANTKRRVSGVDAPNTPNIRQNHVYKGALSMREIFHTPNTPNNNNRSNTGKSPSIIVSSRIEEREEDKSDSESNRSIESSDREFKQAQILNKSSSLFSMGNPSNAVNISNNYKHNEHKNLRQVYEIDVFIILPDDKFKHIWDIIITLLLLFSAIVTPFRIAFYDYDSIEWLVLDLIVDIFFAFDIICNFITAYFDSEENLIIDRKKIACTYLKTWFTIDFVSIIPISLIMNSQRDYTSLARLARLPRLYRLIKMAKLTRMLKIVKERGKFSKYINDMLRLNVGVERLIYFTLIFVLMCHITACMWYLVAKLEDFSPETWVVRGNFQDQSEYDVYVAALYWTISSITTVGYGDIVPGTTNERLVSILVMVIGVCTYSFAIGSLSSVLSTLDSKHAKYKEKLVVLQDLKREYELDPDLYIRLKKALRYDHSRNAEDKFKLLKELPASLRVELSIEMHQEMITRIPFFQNKPAQFIAFIGPLLKPMKIFEGEYIYTEGDPIENIYFLVKGSAALVLRDYNDLAYIYIDEGYYFGEIDLLIGSEEEVGKRMFTVKAMKECELLVLSKTDLYDVDIEYGDIINDLLQNGEVRLKRAMNIRRDAIRYGGGKHKNSSFRPQLSRARKALQHTGASEFAMTLRKIDENEEDSLESNSEFDSIMENFTEEQKRSPKDNQTLKIPDSNTPKISISPKNIKKEVGNKSEIENLKLESIKAENPGGMIIKKDTKSVPGDMRQIMSPTTHIQIEIGEQKETITSPPTTPKTTNSQGEMPPGPQDILSPKSGKHQFDWKTAKSQLQRGFSRQGTLNPILEIKKHFGKSSKNLIQDEVLREEEEDLNNLRGITMDKFADKYAFPQSTRPKLKTTKSMAIININKDVQEEKDKKGMISSYPDLPNVDLLQRAHSKDHFTESEYSLFDSPNNKQNLVNNNSIEIGPIEDIHRNEKEEEIENIYIEPPKHVRIQLLKENPPEYIESSMGVETKNIIEETCSLSESDNSKNIYRDMNLREDIIMSRDVVEESKGELFGHSHSREMGSLISDTENPSGHHHIDDLSYSKTSMHTNINTNVNANVNANVNTNTNIYTNANANTNINIPMNTNTKEEKGYPNSNKYLEGSRHSEGMSKMSSFSEDIWGTNSPNTMNINPLNNFNVDLIDVIHNNNNNNGGKGKEKVQDGEELMQIKTFNQSPNIPYEDVEIEEGTKVVPYQELTNISDFVSFDEGEDLPSGRKTLLNNPNDSST